jgi:fructose PTS system EIIBC or EIIC component
VMFFIAVIAGSIVTAVVVNLLKKEVHEEVAGSVVTEEEVKSKSEKAPEEMPQTKAELSEINQLTDITNLNLINVDLDGSTRDDVIDEMIYLLKQSGSITSSGSFKEAIISREEESTTGIGMNIAIPHGKSDAVKQPSVVFGIKKDGVDWNSLDGSDAKLIFMIAVPKESEGNEHLKILQLLSRQLMDEEYREKLLNVQSREEAYTLLEEIK